eukprot:1804930-Alexandrium_andersonii.AAC.1
MKTSWLIVRTGARGGAFQSLAASETLICPTMLARVCASAPGHGVCRRDFMHGWCLGARARAHGRMRARACTSCP